MSYEDLVPVPVRPYINSGISAAHQQTMLSAFGVPGKLSRECSRVTNKILQKKIFTESVGPFKATGFQLALQDLRAIFEEVHEKDPTLYDLLHSEGMLCVRAVRNSIRSFSNHSWGTAIDLSIGGELDQYGSRYCRKGLLAVYPYFQDRKSVV